MNRGRESAREALQTAPAVILTPASFNCAGHARYAAHTGAKAGYVQDAGGTGEKPSQIVILSSEWPVARSERAIGNCAGGPATMNRD